MSSVALLLGEHGTTSNGFMVSLHQILTTVLSFVRSLSLYVSWHFMVEMIICPTNTAFPYQSGFTAMHTEMSHRCVMQREAGTVWGLAEKYVVTDLIYRREIFRNKYYVINVLSSLWDVQSVII